MFAQGSRSLENIPLTEASLLEHCKRAAYQGGHIWGQTLTLNPEFPSPLEWGWRLTEHGWNPYWTTLPEAPRACHSLIRCGCSKACRASANARGTNSAAPSCARAKEAAPSCARAKEAAPSCARAKELHCQIFVAATLICKEAFSY